MKKLLTNAFSCCIFVVFNKGWLPGIEKRKQNMNEKQKYN